MAAEFTEQEIKVLEYLVNDGQGKAISEDFGLDTVDEACDLIASIRSKLGLSEEK